MSNINETFLINVDISDENCMVEVVIFHGYIREVIKTFYGEDAKKIANILVKRNAIIDPNIIGIEENKISSIAPRDLTDDVIVENEEEITNDRSLEVAEVS